MLLRPCSSTEHCHADCWNSSCCSTLYCLWRTASFSGLFCSIGDAGEVPFIRSRTSVRIPSNRFKSRRLDVIRREEETSRYHRNPRVNGESVYRARWWNFCSFSCWSDHCQFALMWTYALCTETKNPAWHDTHDALVSDYYLSSCIL